MIVLKFGGTSVGNAAMMDRTLDIVSKYLDRSPILVSSAMTKMTDLLLSICKHAGRGESEQAFESLAQLEANHRNAAAELLAGDHPVVRAEATACAHALDSLFGELSSIVRGLCLIREVSPRSQDAVVSFGERLSTRLLVHKAKAKGLSAELVDARSAIKTDEHFTSANLLKDATNEACRAAFQPKPGHLIISQGFIGSTEKGVTTTLGRGGSDYSATIIGAALGAESVEIWTDVDGIMTTDPRVIPHAKVLPEISYAEAAELSYFGAKVIHPSTIQPAVDLGIPVWVKNTKNPAARGTVITPAGLAGVSGVQAIAAKKNISVITVKSTRMINAFGFLRRIFEVFDAHKVSVDLVATSEVSVSVTIEDATHLKAVRRDLEAFAEVVVEDHQAIVCLVGRGLWKDGTFMVKVFTSLKDLPVRLVTMGSSDINLSLVVPQPELEKAIQKLHDALF
jgi:aspartate kinase